MNVGQLVKGVFTLFFIVMVVYIMMGYYDHWYAQRELEWQELSDQLCKISCKTPTYRYQGHLTKLCECYPIDEKKFWREADYT